MKVYHLQVTMMSSGNAPYRLHKAMLEAGIDSHILTYESGKKFFNVRVFRHSIKRFFVEWGTYFFNKLRYHGKKPNTYVYSALPFVGDRRWEEAVKDADVIYIHWIGGKTLSVKNIESIAKLGKPVIFFLHDTFTFTGGCHHFFGCEQYKTGCKNCPMFSHNNIASSQAIKKKNLFGKYKNIHFAGPSHWISTCAEQSFVLKGHQVTAIPNYIDERQFKPLDKKTVREFLNLPHDKFFISFGAKTSTNNPVKGWQYLKEALAKTDFKDVVLLILGNDYDPKIEKEVKYPCFFTGQMRDETSLALWNNAADLYVSPTLAESFGMTYIENALCGVPVIGFDGTAVPETANSLAGLLAKYKDSDDLARCIIEIHDKGFTPSLRENYCSKIILEQHILLMNRLLRETKE